MIRSVVRKRLIPLFFCSAVFLLFWSCGKNTNNNVSDPNSNVYVNINMYANQPDFSPISIPGGWIYKPGGNKGVIIYRLGQSQTSSDFVAFERSCPHDGVSNGNAYVKVQSDNIHAKDTVCGSIFLITDGSVSSGPSGYPLKPYHVSFDGNLLHIFN
ncbi:MAG: hypothetical protein ACJ76F_10285 [Bacteroidia bacterium]